MFKLYSEVHIIKGYSQSLIYDLGRNNAIQVTNDIYEELSSCLRYIKPEFDASSFSNFMVENEFAFKSDEFDRAHIKEIDFSYVNSSRIKRLISKTSDFLNEELLNVIEWSLCPNLILIISKKLTTSHKVIIEEIFQKFYIENIWFVIEESDKESLIYLEQFISSRIEIKFKNSFNSTFSEYNLFDYKIKQTKDLLLNRQIFIESKSHDTFYNGLLVLDDDVNSLKTDQAPFHLFIQNKLEMLNLIKRKVELKSFKLFSNKKKDEISICRDCEFRYMCVDNRIAYERKKGEWFHYTECNYNPYLGKWKGEIGYRNLNECGVISNEKINQIDYSKVAQINTLLCGE